MKTNVYYSGFLLITIALVIFSILLVNVHGSVSVIKPDAPKIPAGSRPSITVTHNPLKCECEINKGDVEICANNGVTYANQCKFDCAQQKVKRLKKVKDGSCKGVTRDEFWGKAYEGP